MKNQNSILSLCLGLGLSLSLFACGNANTNSNKTSSSEHDHSDMIHVEAYEATASDSDLSKKDGTVTITTLIDNYLALKNALVQDDSKAASTAGEMLSKSAAGLDISKLDASKQSEIKEILEVLQEHGEHIAKSEIDHQREHFEGMAKDFMDLLAISGTDRTLYQQYCPMYNKGKGGSWLSESSEIKNPLFGSKMIGCGSVKETIATK